MYCNQEFTGIVPGVAEVLLAELKHFGSGAMSLVESCFQMCGNSAEPPPPWLTPFELIVYPDLSHLPVSLQSS